jgi:hypothetical protein
MLTISVEGIMRETAAAGDKEAVFEIETPS